MKDQIERLEKLIELTGDEREREVFQARKDMDERLDRYLQAQSDRRHARERRPNRPHDRC